MKTISDEFIKQAAAAGDAITAQDRENFQYCGKPAEWAELDDFPPAEQVIRHLLDCPICLGFSGFAFIIHTTMQMKQLALQVAQQELRRRADGN